jgi:WD40 repeat protein
MKTKTILFSFFILTFLLASCGQGTAAPAPVTQTPAATQPPTDIPTQTAIPTSIPLRPIFPPSPTAMPPYPTASVVEANAVAFIAENSLWVANVDGNGERRLTNIQNNESWTSSYLLKWSPDGKWISYLSGNDLWVISPDGSASKKVIEISEADNKNKILSYNWSPDGSEIAYIQTIKGKPIPRLLNLETGDVSDLPINTDQLSLSWSPNGQYILLNTITTLTVLEVNTNRVLKEIRLYGYNHCTIEHGGVTWSPNSKWFYHLVFANGTYALQICLSGLDGSNWYIEDVGYVISRPVWDKTGDYLYLVVGEMDLDNGPNWFKHQRLVRYDMNTRKTEELLSLEEDGPIAYPPIISLSPNGEKLGLYSYIYYENNSQYVDASRPPQNQFIIIDIQSLSKKTFTVELENWIEKQFPSHTWANDNEKIIFFSDSFYSLDVKTGDVSKFSGVHVAENAVISSSTTTP